MSAVRMVTAVPESHFRTLSLLAQELGVNKQTLMAEAVNLLLTAAQEAKAGRRLAIVPVDGRRAIARLVTPLLSQLEWNMRLGRIRKPLARSLH